MSAALVLITEPTGNFTVHRLPGGHGGSDLEALQKIVGGYIEQVGGENFGHIYLNEEGKLMGLPVNLVATAELDTYIPGFSRHDVLVGSVVWLDSDQQGDSADVRPEVLESYARRIIDGHRTWTRVSYQGQTNVFTDPALALASVLQAAGYSRQNPDFGDITVEVTP